jgi:enterochelin esterase-like enzyme
MPMVKQQYPLSENREDHAVAGLSMRGSETLLAGLNHTDTFAYVGGFSSGGWETASPLGFPSITAQSAQDVNSKLRPLWISCGTEDGLFASNQKFIAWLKDQGIKANAVQTPGMRAWMVWRDNLSNFVPLLFQ